VSQRKTRSRLTRGRFGVDFRFFLGLVGFEAAEAGLHDAGVLDALDPDLDPAELEGLALLDEAAGTVEDEAGDGL